jgi:hypothetical protein
MNGKLNENWNTEVLTAAPALSIRYPATRTRRVLAGEVLECGGEGTPFDPMRGREPLLLIYNRKSNGTITPKDE